MNDKNILIATFIIIFWLFVYGFDFGGKYLPQFALIITGVLLGNLITVADYAGENNE